MRHVIKPDETTYHVFYGDVVRHVGVTFAGQTTSSGQPYYIVDADPVAWLARTAHITMNDLPELPASGEDVAIEVYTHNGTRLICHTEHKRTDNEPAAEPEYFVVEQP